VEFKTTPSPRPEKPGFGGGAGGLGLGLGGSGGDTLSDSSPSPTAEDSFGTLAPLMTESDTNLEAKIKPKFNLPLNLIQKIDNQTPVKNSNQIQHHQKEISPEKGLLGGENSKQSSSQEKMKFKLQLPAALAIGQEEMEHKTDQVIHLSTGDDSLYFALGHGDHKSSSLLFAAVNKATEAFNRTKVKRNYEWAGDSTFFAEPAIESSQFHVMKKIQILNGFTLPTETAQYRTFLTFCPTNGPITIFLEESQPSPHCPKAFLCDSQNLSVMLAPTGKNIPNILSFLLSQRYEQSPPKEPVFKEVETSVFLPLFEEEYKKNFIQTNFKVGVLHSPMEGKCGETNLYEQDTVHPDFEEFLECLGTKCRVDPNDPTQDSGGLTDAEYFYSTEYKENHFAFHVAPYISIPPEDGLHIDRVRVRKRHLGNDISVLIFQNSDQILNLDSFLSHFNNIFIIVKKVIINNQTFYSVNVIAKSTVEWFPPQLTERNLFTKKHLRKFLLAKVINGERYALNRHPAFAGRSKVRWNSTLKLFQQFEVQGEASSVFTKK